ncbi:hypothetical protein HYALB_00008831 [Hymenoscyphus albidus]|uniref:Uncharacterized protein n=1 Tax=Hymenoscyphus albidus TaxID=595503 RepID=A0A9N9Q8K4_9HELO|nr:hypothetical protein HYALB_00008831 [Hymenoscyphus albidus]
MDCLSHLQHCTHISTESLKTYLSQPSSTTSNHDCTTESQKSQKIFKGPCVNVGQTTTTAGVENHHLALQTCWTLMTLQEPKTFRCGVSDSTIGQPSRSQRHRSSNYQVRSLSSKTLTSKTQTTTCAQRESRGDTKVQSLLWSENEMESNQTTHATSHSASNPYLLEMHGDQPIVDSPIPQGILGAQSPDAGGEEGMMGGGIVAPPSMYGKPGSGSGTRSRKPAIEKETTLDAANERLEHLEIDGQTDVKVTTRTRGQYRQEAARREGNAPQKAPSQLISKLCWRERVTFSMTSRL